MRRSALGAWGIALVLALGACGDDGGDTTADADGTAAADGPGTASSDGMTMDRLVDAVAEATADGGTASVAQEMTGMGQTMTVRGQARYDTDTRATAWTAETAGSPIEMRIVDGGVYMRLPPEQLGAMGASEDAPWLYGPDDDRSSSGSTPGFAEQLTQQSDPAEALRRIADAGGEVTGTEPDTLGDQRVTRHTVDLDPASAAVLVSGSELTDQQKQALPAGAVPVEVYLDGEGRVLRIETSVGPDGADGFSLLLEYTDWGEPVTVEAPPAAEVANAEDLDG
ncbi:hypothetical protein [Saccharomonospora saliphila]|uniref:hypothetical protein n=1 Tax=Saccharomonospora saliphila TaxID=369829 RepID=UPI0003602BCE|nr:hypothetical protein [Saccharomonospora saliphila]